MWYTACHSQLLMFKIHGMAVNEVASLFFSSPVMGPSGPQSPWTHSEVLRSFCYTAEWKLPHGGIASQRMPALLESHQASRKPPPRYTCPCQHGPDGRLRLAFSTDVVEPTWLSITCHRVWPGSSTVAWTLVTVFKCVINNSDYTWLWTSFLTTECIPGTNA